MTEQEKAKKDAIAFLEQTGARLLKAMKDDSIPEQYAEGVKFAVEMNDISKNFIKRRL